METSLRKVSIKRGLVAALALGVGLLCVAPVAAEISDLKYTIRVGTFENRSGWSGWLQLSGAWSTILTDQLNQTGRFIVVGEADMRNEALEEQALGASGLTAQGKITPQRGQLTPSQLLVKGVITSFQRNASDGGGRLSYKGIGFKVKKQTTEMQATLYVIDASTGAVLASKSVTGEAISKKRGLSLNRDGVNSDLSQSDNDNNKTAIADAIKKAVEWMARDIGGIPWRGSIVAIKGDQIYIDRGTREGVSKGMKMTVGESEIIRSPDTGEVLDEIVTERAQVEIVRVKEKVSVCRVVSGDSTILSEGMGVMPSTSL